MTSSERPKGREGAGLRLVGSRPLPSPPCDVSTPGATHGVPPDRSVTPPYVASRFPGRVGYYTSPRGGAMVAGPSVYPEQGADDARARPGRRLSERRPSLSLVDSDSVMVGGQRGCVLALQWYTGNSVSACVWGHRWM